MNTIQRCVVGIAVEFANIDRKIATLSWRNRYNVNAATNVERDTKAPLHLLEVITSYGH